ncbi:MAG: hypothetical protein HY673_18370 [Chloroflexi bacterium]|nr:hypothetical protein [Chloroflexota bacterium]
METPEDIIDFVDCAGKRRKFKFEVLDAGPMVRLEAKEIRKDGEPGYYFREIGMADHIPVLRGRLHLKIMEGLSKRYMAPQRKGIGRWRMLSDELAGYVGFDESKEQACVVVDGFRITWEEFESLVQSHEGFFVRIKFED